MWIEKEFTRTLDVDGTAAAVDKLGVARSGVEKLLGRCFQGVIVKKIGEILYVGDIEIVRESQACSVATMVVQFRAWCQTVQVQDAMLLRAKPASESLGVAQFVNGICVGIPLDDRMAAPYREQLVPMVIDQVLMRTGLTQATAYVKPWLASTARAPVIVQGKLDAEQAARLEAQTATLAELRQAVPESTLKLFGVRARGKKSLRFAELARECEKLGAAAVIALDLGHAGGFFAPLGKKESAEAVPLPLDVGLSLLVLREYQLLSMATELTEDYPEAVDDPEQAPVWKMVQTI
jgi:hypothetical protein